jgi:hypothetical protein
VEAAFQIASAEIPYQKPKQELGRTNWKISLRPQRQLRLIDRDVELDVRCKQWVDLWSGFGGDDAANAFPR